MKILHTKMVHFIIFLESGIDLEVNLNSEKGRKKQTKTKHYS